MLISTLLEHVKTLSLFSDTEINAMTADPGQVVPGCVFFCKGTSPGEDEAAARVATQRGAAAIISQCSLHIKKHILVDDSKAAYSLASAAFFGYPARKLSLTGVTGTNGKTTTCILIKNIFESIGIETGLIGSVKNAVCGHAFSANFSTPDAFELHRLLADMVVSGCTHCVIEFSSQALAEKTAQGLRFAAAVFTNLSQNHLDYHGDIEHYMAAKHILFENTDLAIINLDDEAAGYFMQGIGCPCVTFSVKTDASNYTAKNIRLKPGGAEYELVGKGVIGRVQFNVPGVYSVYNSMGAAVCATEMGVPFRQVLEALADSKELPGSLADVPENT